jgi:dTDP-glucose pyrophosphorylase
MTEKPAESAAPLEAIILAGGLGTRLRTLVSDRPKPMARVAGRPFLELLLDMLASEGIAHVVLSIGYRGDEIRSHFGSSYAGISLEYSEENEPLGTGGAIQRALERVAADPVFVLNGDTYLELPYAQMLERFREHDASVMIALHHVRDTSLYGVVEVEGDRVVGFEPRGDGNAGWVNSGVYLIQRSIFAALDLRAPFSFESDFLVPEVADLQPACFLTKGLFIDIGAPESFMRAQELLSEVDPGADRAEKWKHYDPEINDETDAVIKALRAAGYFVAPLVLTPPIPDRSRYHSFFSREEVYMPCYASEFIRGLNDRLSERGKWTPVTRPRQWVIWNCLQQVRSLEGEVWEAGVYQGGSALLLKEAILKLEIQDEVVLRLFDTFEGMLEVNASLDLHDEGDFSDTSLADVKALVGDEPFLDYRVGKIPETFEGLEDAKLRFVHVDLDLYDAIRATLDFVYERVVRGGVIVFDDYGSPSCPGARAAVDEFFEGKPEVPIVQATGQALLFKI